MRPNPLVVSACLLAAAPALVARTLVNASNATLVGQVRDDQGRPLPRARVRLESPVSGYRQTTLADAQGRFTLYNIPYNDYHLEVLVPGFQEAHRDLELRSSLPVDLTLTLKPQGAEVAVEEVLSLVEGHPSVHLDIDRSTIDRIPSAVQSRAMENILLATPGFVANDNGRFHFRGSHGQLTWVVDGVPLSDQTHATHSNSMDPAQVESMEVITGGISAEYGGKPVAVVHMTTKSGLGTEGGFAGEVSAGLARFGTTEAGFSARGGGDRFGWFVTGAGSGTDRFLDPVDFRNFHNHGTTGRLFARFDWILGDADTLRLSASGGRTHRDVVNLASQQAAGMNQRFATGDANLSLAWTHLFNSRQSLDASVYARRATARLDPTRRLEPGFQEGGPDFPVWAAQDRSLENQGVQLAFNQRLGTDSSLRAGLQYVAFPLQEAFQLAITSDALVTDPDSPLFAYTPAGGGHIWSFATRLRPSLASAFVQSDLHAGNLFLALGLRYDAWTFRGLQDSELQPRIGLSWRFPATGTVLRVSYDRLFITPDRENLGLSSSHEAAELGEAEEGHDHGVHQVRPEVQDAWSAGLEQQFGRWGRLSFEYWTRNGRNTADVEQFLNTGAEFPIALARGFFRGWNLRIDLVPVQGFSAYLSLGRTRAMVEGPVTGGLEVHTGHEAHEPAGRFPIDHDQKLTAQLGLRFEREDWWLQAIGRYDSGLVAGEPEDAQGNPDLAFGLPHIRYDAGDAVWRVEPRTTWNFGAGWKVGLGPGRQLVLAADLLNAFDKASLYNFLSHRGGTHVFPARTLAVRVKLRF